MRDITKILSVPAEGKPADFRLTKLGAFSGATLLRMLSRMPEGSENGGMKIVLSFPVSL